MEIGFTIRMDCLIHLPDAEFALPDDFFERKSVKDAYWAKVKAHLDEDLHDCVEQAHYTDCTLLEMNLT